MTAVLYLDVFFAANLLMNLILLCLVDGVLKLCGKRKRILAASGFGAAAAGLMVLGTTMGWNLWGQINERDIFWQLLRLTLTGLVFYGMFVIAFGRRKWEDLIRMGGFCMLVTAAAGGCFEAVFTGRMLQGCGFLCCAAGICFGGRILLDVLRRQERLKENLYDVILHHGEKHVEVTAFLDTGNRLYEPYGHQPVHVITKEIAARIADIQEPMVYIPFSAVGTEHGMLPGIRIDAMELKKHGEQIRRVERPWLAVSAQPLSGNHQYEMLLHGEEK